jgi:hypothetical protein
MTARMAVDTRSGKKRQPGDQGGHRRVLGRERGLTRGALAWAAKIAVACRCAQEVRELMPDAEQDAMLRQADGRG